MPEKSKLDGVMRDFVKSTAICIRLRIRKFTKSGKILLVESKSDNPDNSNSVRKLNLGKIWAGKAGSQYKYLMVFDQNSIENAYKLDEIIKIIVEL